MKFDEVIRSKKLLLIAFFLVFAVGVGIGLLTSFGLRKSNSTNSDRIHLNPSYSYINPLLECDSADENFGSFQRVEGKLEEYIDSEVRKGHINATSVYLRDLNNGPWVGINEKDEFSPASLIKVPLLIAYLKLAEADPRVLEFPLTIKNIDAYKDQNMIPSTLLGLGQQYKTIDLLRQMIIYSDNVAYDTLITNIKGFDLDEIYKDFGVDISKGLKDPAGNILSVKDYASFFRILFNASYLSDKNSELALEILTQSMYGDGLRAGVPSDIAIAHKFGERRYLLTSETQLHDCGIVYLPENPYLLCVMTKGTDFSQLNSVIAEISRIVYLNVSQ